MDWAANRPEEYLKNTVSKHLKIDHHNLVLFKGVALNKATDCTNFANLCCSLIKKSNIYLV